MKNTIITSISALVFLVIGLFIGKSNNPIEIKNNVKKSNSEAVPLGWREIPPNLKSITIIIDIHSLTNQLNVESIRNQIELESLRLGLNIKTNDISDAILKFEIHTTPIENSELLAYESELFIMAESEFKIGSTVYSNLSEIWNFETMGHFHPNYVRPSFEHNLKLLLEAMSRDFLRTKNIAH